MLTIDKTTVEKKAGRSSGDEKREIKVSQTLPTGESGDSPYPDWLEGAVFYQIYPQSFYDSNGDGVGDLLGIINKLDYLQSLGITALWLNPVFDSPMGDAGYDVRDFYKVDARYGTNEDVVRLFEEAHKRGMSVVMDLVAGHTSVEHPWFKQSCRHERNQYSDYYIWTPSVCTQPTEGHWINGYGDRDGNYLTNYYWIQPALNYGYANPDPEKPWQQPMDAPGPQAVRKEFRDIMTFWLDLGCDGFRVDYAHSLIKGENSDDALRAFWLEQKSWLASRWPEAALIAEWGNPRQAIGSGFNIDFMLHYGAPAYNHLFGPTFPVDGDSRTPHVFFERAGGGNIQEFLTDYLSHYETVKERGFISLPTGNHDFPRLRRGRSEKELRVIHAMLLTMPGVPFLYYGDEIGMNFMENLPTKEGSYGKRTGSRTPMQWSSGEGRGFSTASSEALYLPVDCSEGSPDVESQEQDPDSHLNLVRRLLQLRKECPALGNASEFQPVYAEKNEYPFVYERKASGGQTVLVALNPRSEDSSLRLPQLSGCTTLLAEGASVDGNMLMMEGISFGLFLMDEAGE